MSELRANRDRFSAPASLDAFLQDLGELPLLSPERIHELATTVRGEEDAFRAALEKLPAVSCLVVERWSLRRSQGRVTGLLSQHYRDDRTKDWSAFIDERIGHLAELVAGGEAEPAQLAQVLSSSSIDIDLLHEFALYLRELANAPASRATRRRRKELRLVGRGCLADLVRAEQALVARDEARQTIAAHNMRLVVHVAKRYRGNGVPFSDLIQEGGLGLMRAVDKFDPTLGYRFSTYAVWWIEQSMIRAIQKYSRTVRVPSHVYEEQLRVRRAEETLRGRFDREVAAGDIAEQIGSEESAVERLLIHMAPAQSLDAPVATDDDRKLGDSLEDPRSCDWEEHADLATARSVLDQALKKLTPRERDVLTWRFGLEGREELTLQQIGDRLSLSRERVRQVANEAMAKLRSRDGVQGLGVLVRSGMDD